MAYEVLEKDEHGYAIHDIESDGYESWIQNYYTEDGKFKDLRIIHSKVPPGYRSEWTNKVWENGYDLYSKYNEKGEMIAEYCTDRFNNNFYPNQRRIATNYRTVDEYSPQRVKNFIKADMGK